MPVPERERGGLGVAYIVRRIRGSLRGSRLPEEPAPRRTFPLHAAHVENEARSNHNPLGDQNGASGRPAPDWPLTLGIPSRSLSPKYSSGSTTRA